MQLLERQTFPLVPRRRPVGLPFGDLPTRRRGHGGDVVGTRPYEMGDPISTIDWFASARISAATGSDQFIVRERSADEAPRVVVICDRRPGMALYEPPLPWLSKPRVVAEATASIVASALVARADVGSIDYAGGRPHWLAPARRDVPWLVAERQAGAPFDAPEDNLAEAFDYLGSFRTDLPHGTFVFVLSDFLVMPGAEGWLRASGHGWDVVPVVIQDPTWEQSFPDIGSVLVPFGDPRDERVRLVRMSRREARERRRENEERLERLVADLVSYGLEPVMLTSNDPHDVDSAFLEWAELRRRSRWVR